MIMMNYKDKEQKDQCYDRIQNLDQKITILEKRLERYNQNSQKHIDSAHDRIDSRVNWGIRTISYTSLVISLGLTMVVSIIAFTFRTNIANNVVITTWELILIIFSIFLFFSISFVVLIFCIKKFIVGKKWKTKVPKKF